MTWDVTVTQLAPQRPSWLCDSVEVPHNRSGIKISFNTVTHSEASLVGYSYQSPLHRGVRNSIYPQEDMAVLRGITAE